MSDPNDPMLRAFVAVAPESDFPIQNLPYGVFSTTVDATPRVGVAIGDFILDLAILEAADLLSAGDGKGVFAQPSINAFMALGPAVWTRTRARISALLRHDNAELRDNAALRARALVPATDARMHLPVAIAGFTDFYSSKEHATNVGVMFRDKSNPLLPNWLHIPIGYNGRASTVVVSGTEVRRPHGQLKPPAADAPSFGPSKRLDFELEMGIVVGQPSRLGERLSEAEADAMIFGFTLLNDWSARDIQQWEYVPLGPFQAKAFATSISPWVVTREALEPFRVHGPRQEPAPLPYLQQSCANNYDLTLDVTLRTARMTTPERICRTNFKTMYWSSVQQLVHHECRRPARVRYHQRCGEGPARQPARTELGRRGALATRRRRDPHISGRWRFARLHRLVPGRRLPHRLRRGRGHHFAGEITRGSQGGLAQRNPPGSTNPGGG
jgi:fumarylacetoacetase